MSDDIGALTVGTVQDLHDHDATRSCWGCFCSHTPIEDSRATPEAPSHARALPISRSVADTLRAVVRPVQRAGALVRRAGALVRRADVPVQPTHAVWGPPCRF